jgi:very-short-patch-repair endonuclease
MQNEKTIFIGNIEIKQYPNLILPANPNFKVRAKAIRQARNLSEVLFWIQVTKGGFHKIDFDRQKVIGNNIVDFYVKKLRLIIEIDGSSHIGKEDYDAERERFLVSVGLRMYRISVFDVMRNMHRVIEDLEHFIVEHYGVR